MNYRDVEDAISSIISFVDYSLNNANNYKYWINILTKLLNPGYLLYSSSVHEIEDKNLPFHYLFPGSRVYYNNRCCTVTNVGKHEITIKYPHEERTFDVSLSDFNLSINDALFSYNYSLWLSSINIGEEVDFYVDTNNVRDWYCGVVEDIAFDQNEISLITIKTCLQNNANHPDYHQTIHGFSIKSLNRPFSKAKRPTPSLQPFRYVFDRNIHIPNSNMMVCFPKGKPVKNENGMIYPKLYISTVNSITMGNVWHSICVAMDV